MEGKIHRDTGLSLELYVQSMEEFDEAFLNMQNQEYEEAITGFQNVLALNKNHPQSYGNLGLCYAFLGKKQEALSALDKALEIDPKYEPAQKNRAILVYLKDVEKMPDSQIEIVEFYKKVNRRKRNK